MAEGLSWELVVSGVGNGRNFMRVAEVPVFVDTNVLVHAFDQSAGNKRNRARTLLDQLWLDLRGHLSVQVLQKFFVVGIQRVRRPLAGIS